MSRQEFIDRVVSSINEVLSGEEIYPVNHMGHINWKQTLHLNNSILEETFNVPKDSLLSIKMETFPDDRYTVLTPILQPDFQTYQGYSVLLTDSVDHDLVTAIEMALQVEYTLLSDTPMFDNREANEGYISGAIFGAMTQFNSTHYQVEFTDAFVGDNDNFNICVILKDTTTSRLVSICL